MEVSFLIFYARLEEWEKNKPDFISSKLWQQSRTYILKEFFIVI